MPVSLNEDKVVTASAGIKSNELPCAMRKNYTTFEAFFFFFLKKTFSAQSAFGLFDRFRM